jgi:hypothetical protein
MIIGSMTIRDLVLDLACNMPLLSSRLNNLMDGMLYNVGVDLLDILHR